MKDVTDYSVEMVIKYENIVDGSISVLDTVAGYLVDDTPAYIYEVSAANLVIGTHYIITSTGDTDFTLVGAADSNVGTEFDATGAGSGTGLAETLIEASGTYLNGNVAVVIDKAVTATYATLVGTELNPFTTEYNYFYTIDITEDDAVSIDKENIRILRGKLAVRE